MDEYDWERARARERGLQQWQPKNVYQMNWKRRQNIIDINNRIPIPQHTKIVFLWVYYIAFMCPDLVHQRWTMNRFYFFVYIPFHFTDTHKTNKRTNEQLKKKISNFIHYYKRIREHIDHNSNGQTHLKSHWSFQYFRCRCRCHPNWTFLRWQFVSN